MTDRKAVLKMVMSLDGFVTSPDGTHEWMFEWFGDDSGRWNRRALDEAKAGQRLREGGTAMDQHRPFVVAGLQLCDACAQVPEDLDRSPLRLFEGVREHGFRFVVHRRGDRTLGRGPVRPHDLVAPAAHRVNAGFLERAEVPLVGIVAEPLEHPLVGAVEARGEPVQRHDHLENDFSLPHDGGDSPSRVNSSLVDEFRREDGRDDRRARSR